MAVDADTFKTIMSRWASGVTVVTCRRPDGTGARGMTASAFTSLSLDPPLVLVCVATRNWTHELIREQRAFGVHILDLELEELSNRCAGFVGEEGHWLDDVPSHSEVTGAPILDEALAWMDCSLWEAYPGGDHTIYVGEIQAGGVQGGRPLLWFSRGYRALSE